MATITVNLSDARLRKLQDLAKRFNIPAEELLRTSFEELVARPQEDFQKALEHVLETYKELYQRLA
jgi:predicted transcriptional regulator